LMFTTVIGFTVCLLVSMLFVVHYLKYGMHSSDASRIDPKPDTKF
jgi:hypothetical protein